MKKAKKILTMVIALCMLFTMSPGFPLEGVFANTSTDANADTTRLAQLGFNTNSSQYQSELSNKESNPLGPGVVALNEIPELLISTSSYSSYWSVKSMVLGKNDNDKRFMPTMESGIYKNQLETGTGANVNTNIIGISHLKEVALDPVGSGKANYIARVYGVNHANVTNLTLRIINAVSGDQVGGDFSLGNVPFVFFQHQTGAFLSMAVGDYNGDGKDELAIYVPQFSGAPNVAIYQVNPAAASNAYPVSWYCKYNLQQLCGLSYISDMKANGMGSSYLSLPAVDLATIPNHATNVSKTDDLAIAVSPGRNLHKYGAPSWSNGPEHLYTRVLVVRDPMKRNASGEGLTPTRFNMYWQWSDMYYKNVDQPSRYETMLFGGVASGDVDGDGHDDIIVAGYRIASDTNDTTAGDRDYAHIDKDRYLVTYIRYNPEKKYYDAPVTAQWVNAAEGDDYHLNENLEDENNRIDNLLQPLSVAAFQERGTGYADSIFVSGVISRLNTASEATSQGNTAGPSELRNATFSTGRFDTIYKVPFKNLFGSAGINRWISDPIQGNFSANPFGMEDLIFLYGYKTSGGTSNETAIYLLVSLSQTSKGDLSASYANGKIENHVIRTQDGQTFASNYSAATISAPDVDDDSALIKFLGEKEFYFSNPHVLAVLQAAPYFEDLAIKNENYASSGTTSLQYSKGSGTGQSHDVSVSAGTYVGFEMGDAMMGGFGLEAEIKLNVGYGYENEKETVFSTGFTTTSEDDSVVAVVTPYIKYKCQTWIPAFKMLSEQDYLALKKSYDDVKRAIDDAIKNVPKYYGSQGYYQNMEQLGMLVKKVTEVETLLKKYKYGDPVPGHWEDTSISIPQESRLTQIDVTTYDAVAEQSGGKIQKVRGVGNVLASIPGDPDSYADSNAGLMDWLGGSTVVKSSPSDFLGLGVGPTGSTASQSIEVSENTSHTITWGASYDSKFYGMYGGGKIGYTFGLAYDGGYSFMSMAGQVYEGSVASISAEDKALGYNFNWQFGIWMSTLNGESCLVLGYLVDDVLAPPSAPKNLRISDVQENSLYLSWEPGTVPGEKYMVYRRDNQGEYFPMGEVSGNLTYYDNECQPGTAYTYAVRAWSTQEGYGVYSAPATGYTNPSGDVPRILSQPGDMAVQAGADAEFSVSVQPSQGGVRPVVYEWQVYDGKLWKALPISGTTGTNTEQLTIKGVSSDLNGYRYRCRISQMVGYEIKSLYSNSAALRVVRGTSGITLTAPSPSSGPADVKYSVSATNVENLPTEIKANLSSIPYSVLIPGEMKSDSGGNSILVPISPASVYYLRGTEGENNETVYYRVEAGSAGKITDTQTASTELVSGDVTKITMTDTMINEAHDKHIEATILDVEPVTGASLTVSGTTYFDAPTDVSGNPQNYYFTHSQNGETVYRCFDTQGASKYYYYDGNAYLELIRTTVCSVNGIRISEMNVNLLTPYVKPIATSVLINETKTQTGNAVPLTATVTGDGDGSPDGAVIFTIRSTTTNQEIAISATLLPGSGNTATASYSWMPQAGGMYMITAYYGGGKELAGSKSEAQYYNAYVPELINLGLQVEGQQEYGSQLALNPSTIDASGNVQPVGDVQYAIFGSSRDASQIAGNVFTPEAAGEYTILASYTDGQGVRTATVDLSIEKKPLMIRAQDQTVEIENISGFDPNNDHGALDVQGIAGQDSPSDIRSLFQVKCNYANAVGDYDITVTFNPRESRLANYSISTVSAKLHVTGDQATVAFNEANISAKLFGSNATVRNNGSVVMGQEVVFTAIPPIGKVVDQWTVNDTPAGAGNSITKAITGHTTVSVTFKDSAAVLQYSALGSGSISAQYKTDSIRVITPGSGVTPNQAIIFSAIPLAGHTIEQWTIDSKVVESSPGIKHLEWSLELPNGVSKTTVIQVKFVPVSVVSYYVSCVTLDEQLLETDLLGTASVTSGNVTGGKATQGEAVTLTAKPEDGYAVKEWGKVTGTEYERLQSGGATYTIDNLQEDQYLYVVFKTAQLFDVSFSVEGDPAGGSLIAATSEGSISSGDPVSEGRAVTFTASPEQGMMIGEWKINGSTQEELGNTLTVTDIDEGADVTVSFVPLVTYAITATGDHVGKRIERIPDVPEGDSNLIREGGSVTITLTPEQGYEITSVTGATAQEIAKDSGVWEVTKTTVLSDIVLDVRTAEIGSGGSGGGGGGGGSTAPLERVIQMGALEVPFTVSGGRAVLSFDQGIFERLTDMQSNEISLDFSEISGVRSTEIPRTALELIAGNQNSLSIRLTSGEAVFLNGQALASIVEQANGEEVRFSILSSVGSDLTSEQRTFAAGKNIFDITITSEDVNITDFNNHPIRLTLHYALRPGESARGVNIWHLGDNGVIRSTNAEYDDSLQLATAELNHLSLYAVGYEEPWENPFADVKENDWFYQGVRYANQNGLFSGISENTFGPNVPMSRGMMVTVLYRMEGSPESSSAAFTDVTQSAYYAKAVAWAAENDIVSGMGNGLFAPNKEITREQMALMLHNYARHKELVLPANRQAGAFSDEGLISGWARDAVNVMYAAEVLSGKERGGFDPQGKATRAEVATMFMNFAAKI